MARLLAVSIVSLCAVFASADTVFGTDTAEDAEIILALTTADIEAGEATAALCVICHTLEEGGADGVGPNLYDIVGAIVGARGEFVYSEAFAALNQSSVTWTFGFLDRFLENPSVAVPGTRMGFLGIGDETTRINLIAYLRTLSNNPVPLAPAGLGDGALEPLAFSERQVEEGQTRFVRAGCANCHAPNLVGVVDTREDGDGDGPPLVGRRFVERWFGGQVADLFRYIVETMPPDRPGTLSNAQYAEVLAFILSGNGFRAGEVPLPDNADALTGIGFYQ